MLSTDLIKIVPDLSGSRSSNRFGFQGDWAICEMLERFSKDDDFIFLFDYHEDIVVLSNELVDFKADFYQVKTESTGKGWDKNALIKGKKSKRKSKDNSSEEIELPSIMGKLYANKYNFKDGVKSLNMISNARFKFTLNTGLKSDNLDVICLVDLATDDLKEFTDHIELKYTLTHSCDFPNYTYFKVTSLSLNDSKTHTTGKIAEVLDALFPATEVSSSRIYKTLADDIKRKNDKEKSFTDFEQLIREKGISKAEIQKIFASNIKLSSENTWTIINGELLNDGLYNFQDRMQLKDKYREIYLRVPFSTTVFQKAKEQIFLYYKQNCVGMTFTGSIEHILTNLKISDLEAQSNDPFFLRAMIIYSIYE